jgi:hypothetical protein
MTIPEAWKRRLRSDLEQYEHFDGEPRKSLGHFDRMVDLGFLPVNSQEGFVSGQRVPTDLAMWRAAKYCSANGGDAPEYKSRGVTSFLPSSRGSEYTERAYVTGFMPRRLATYAWAYVNLTDKVCVLEDYGVPVTYAGCFGVDHGGVPADMPFPGTRITATCSHKMAELKRLEKEGGEPYSFVQFFDPTHGRAARAALYPDVIKCLRKGVKAQARDSREPPMRQK